MKHSTRLLCAIQWLVAQANFREEIGKVKEANKVGFNIIALSVVRYLQ